jgi:hypothetical protein
MLTPHHLADAVLDPSIELPRSPVHHGVMYLRWFGHTADQVPGHAYHLHIEESSGAFMTAGGEGEFEMPWLRAACSCGWRAEKRYTIDDNARWNWLTRHIDPMTIEGHLAGDLPALVPPDTAKP